MSEFQRLVEDLRAERDRQTREARTRVSASSASRTNAAAGDFGAGPTLAKSLASTPAIWSLGQMRADLEALQSASTQMMKALESPAERRQQLRAAIRERLADTLAKADAAARVGTLNVDQAAFLVSASHAIAARAGI